MDKFITCHNQTSLNKWGIVDQGYKTVEIEAKIGVS